MAFGDELRQTNGYWGYINDSVRNVIIEHMNLTNVVGNSVPSGPVISIDPANGTITLMLTVDIAGGLSAPSLPTRADEAAASDLTAGDFYKTATGEVRIKL